jgi:hypothetical protein
MAVTMEARAGRRVSTHTLLAKLDPFKGKQLITCIDDIQTIADEHGYSVNVIDPEFNTASIDNEATRLNVRTDKDSVITSFTIG